MDPTPFTILSGAMFLDALETRSGDVMVVVIFVRVKSLVKVGQSCKQASSFFVGSGEVKREVTNNPLNYTIM
jgi:hypothetical protein